MTVLGYIRVSNDKQDLQKQEHLLLKYAQQHDLQISDFINPHLEKPISYPAYRYFVRQDPELLNLW